jgi:threonine dehydrogenase-like Zn-dependent dehydrogenase
MPLRLALVGDHVCEWLPYEQQPLRPGEVRLKTEYASGKYGTWAAMLDPMTFGDAVFDPATRLFTGAADRPRRQVSREHPLSFGTSAVGTVTEVGSEVKTVRPGDRVIAMWGDICQSNTVEERNVRPLGEVDPLLALCVESAFVSFHCVRESNVRYGDCVVVVGLGALGLIAVRIAQQSGAGQVIAIDPVAGRRRMAKKLGASAALDPRGPDDVAKIVHDLTGGAGADVSIELSGAYPGFATAIRCTRMTGTVCTSGFYRGEAKSIYFGREYHHNQLTMIVPHGCGNSGPARDYPRWDDRRAFDAILSMMGSGKMDVASIVDPVVGMDDAPDIFRRLRDEADSIAKFAVKFS